jgi:Tol biopolymer transport system component
MGALYAFYAIVAIGKSITCLFSMRPVASEQAAGKPADKRADIWSFGVVLWEMLTGSRLFDGETISHTLADVLRAPIDLGKLPKDTPAAVRNLIARCLERDVKRRLRDIGEARIVLDCPVSQVDEPPAKPRPGALPWIVAAGLAVVVAAIAVWAPWRQPASQEKAVHFHVDPPRGAQFVFGRGGGSAISPDGRIIAFVAVSTKAPMLWVRPLDSLTARELPGTEGARFPFWSPDSRSLAFFADGKLKRIDLAGGAPSVITDAPNSRGGTWNEQGTIVFVGRYGDGLQRVSASGGIPSPVLPLDTVAGETNQRWPQFLPGGRRTIYFSSNRDPRKTGIFLGSLDRPSERTWLVESVAGSAYVAPTGRRSGYLVWTSQESLIARPFDPGTARFTGEVLQVPGAESPPFLTGAFNPGVSVSNEGDILYASGSERFRLGWFNRGGTLTGAVGQPGDISSLRISPDGTRASVSAANASGQRDVAVVDFARGLQTRLPSGGLVGAAIWSPDSQRIVYYLQNSNSILERSATGSGQPATIVNSSKTVSADDFSPDGRYLMYEENTNGRFNLWLFPRGGQAGDGKPIAYLKTSSSETNAQFSPDSKWVAYTSDQSGHEEVYVQSLPASDQKWQVSENGGSYARWRRDGKELFYRASDGKLMVASVRPGPHGLEFGKPEALFRVAEPAGLHTYPYDVSADGQRILTFTAGSEDNSSALTVLMNWRAGLKQ